MRDRGDVSEHEVCGARHEVPEDGTDHSVPTLPPPPHFPF